MACKVTETWMYPWFIVVTIALVMAILVRELAPVRRTDAGYTAKWHGQEWNVSITLKHTPRSFRDRVSYLAKVVDAVMVNYGSGRRMSYRVRIRVGGDTHEFREYGCFNSAKVVLYLIDVGLIKVFKGKMIDICLIE